MRSLRQALCDAAARLMTAGIPDARLDAEWLLAYTLHAPRLTMLAALNRPLSEADGARFQAAVARRETGEPLQYVLGEADFMGYTFAVDPRVLIPRCDTEALCEATAKRVRPGDRVLDLGTGSGALAASLALLCPGSAVTGIDISEGALQVARANGERLGAAVEWVQSDLFSALAGRWFDVVVSNPPYIPEGMLPGLQREVSFEPRRALDGGADGLVFFRRIAEKLAAHLVLGGALLVEVGDGQAEAVCEMFAGRFQTIDVLRDLKGLERVVTGDGYAG